MPVTLPHHPVDMIRLNSITRIYRPSTPGPADSGHPTTILILEWNGANPRSTSKYGINGYITHYKDLYPGASIVSFASTPMGFLLNSSSTRRDRFRDAIPILRSDPVPTARLLVHLFSNGGAVSLCDMCMVWKEEMGTCLPIRAIVLDSAPGNPGLNEGWAGITPALPKGLLWYPTAAVAAVILTLMWLLKNFFGWKTIVEHARTWLNDGQLVNLNAPRCYIYSTEDKLVGWRDVERHALEAEGLGVHVNLVKLDKSEHVQHLGQMGDGYWKAVRKLWEYSRCN